MPSIGFTFKTDPLETARSDFSVMGSEVNGTMQRKGEEAER